MARPKKEGLDYFPLDCDIDQDDKVQLVEAAHGLFGFAVIIKLLMKIYNQNYYYSWTEKEQLLFSKRVNVDINRINEVINDCLKWGIFNQDKYDDLQILTSKGIQRRYLEAVGRRQRVKILDEHLLLDEDTINVYKNLVIEGVNVNINPQRKEKNRKEKKSKEKEVNSNSCSQLLKLYEELGFGLLNPYIANEISSLQEQYTSTWVEDALKHAMDQGKRKMSYVKGILKNWKSEGREEAKKDGKSKSSNSKQLIDEGIGLNLEDLS